jgi:hypothetical protein
MNFDAVTSASNVLVAAAAVWVTWRSSSESNKINRRMLRNSLFDKKKAIRDALIDMVSVRPVMGGDAMSSAHRRASQATADLSLLISDEQVIQMRDCLLADYSAAIDARYDWEDARDAERQLDLMQDIGHASIENRADAIEDKKEKRRAMNEKYKCCEQGLASFKDLLNREISLHDR